MSLLQWCCDFDMLTLVTDRTLDTPQFYTDQTIVQRSSAQSSSDRRSSQS